MATTCKFYKYKQYVSYDSGVTWIATGEYDRGELYEANSTDCGYVPPAPKFTATYNDGTTYTAYCNDSSTLTFGETKPSGHELSSMTSAVIGDCVEYVGRGVFAYCTNLSSVTIPNSVKSIGQEAFWQCSGLTNINIPNSVITIGDDAFTKTSLTSVTIPDSVTSIGYRAFGSCYDLVQVSLGSGITSISSSLFIHCDSLSSITIPSSVTTIDQNAFAYCSSLTSLTIPENVTYIGYQAFLSCSWLQSITVNSPTPIGIGSKAFDTANDCPIYVPCASVAAYKDAWSVYKNRIQGIPPCSEPAVAQYRWVDLDPSTDYYCSGLTKYYKQQKQVSYDSGETWTNVVPAEYQSGGVYENYSTDCGYVPPTPSEYAANVNNGERIVSCKGDLYWSDLTNRTEAWGGYASGITSVTIGSCVSSFTECCGSGPVGTFSSMSFSSLTIPTSVVNIGYNCFYKCTNLRSINIPNTVATIGTYGFYYCTSLTSVTIGSNVTTIGHECFNYCSSLQSVTVNAVTPPNLGYDAFNRTNNCPIYVPAASVEAYKAATNWSTYAGRIQAIP